MKFKGVKLAFFAVALVFLLFFSNDFGLIDVEKTAIITAVAIDPETDGSYKVTAQIAVPEATDTNTENERAQISGTGATVGAAIKNIGDTSGWFPQLCFCNLIIVGGSFTDYNIVKILDYFSKTLRVQDSALIVMAENSGAELLKLSTPLDNISAFALQKILLKNAGLNRDVATTDVKKFCTGYYSDARSCYMPIIKVISQKEENEKASAEDGNGGESGNGSGQSTGGQSSPQSLGGAKGDAIFNASCTALFLEGKKVGELDEKLTFAFNALTQDLSATTFEVKNVETSTDTRNYLLTIFSCTPRRELIATENGLRLDISLDIYARISDENAEYSDVDYVKNVPVPYFLKEKAESDLRANLEDLVRTEIQTGCDFLGIKKELYGRYNSLYRKYKDDYLQRLSFDVRVNVSGQK